MLDVSCAFRPTLLVDNVNLDSRGSRNDITLQLRLPGILGQAWS